MRKFECNQIHEGSSGGGNVRCKYRCTIVKFKIEAGKMGRTTEKVTDTLHNQCRLITGRSKKCMYPDDNEQTCNIPKYKD